MGTGGGRPRPTPNAKHALDDVPVVGNGAPPHAVVALPKVCAQRQYECRPVRRWLAAEDRAVAVSNRSVARSYAHVVVEAHHDTLRSSSEHSPIGRSDVHEVCVRRGSRRRCERRAHGERDQTGGALQGSNDHGLREVLTCEFVIFHQFVDDGLGCASYLVGDEHEGSAVIVDPAYAIEQYLDEASRQDVRLIGVLETHTHADHLSGHGRLALDHGCTVHVHPAAEAEFPFEPLEDGGTIELGAVSIRTIHTPGHRPEHCAFAVSDRNRADEPWLVLTGDSLFVGDAARPDLAIEARDGRRGLVPLAAPPGRAPRRCRGLPRATSQARSAAWA